MKFTQQQTLNNSQLIDQLGVRHAETTKNKISSGVNTTLADDFLKKIKMQHDNIKKNDNLTRGSGANANESDVLRQQLGQPGL